MHFKHIRIITRIRIILLLILLFTLELYSGKSHAEVNPTRVEFFGYHFVQKSKNVKTLQANPYQLRERLTPKQYQKRRTKSFLIGVKHPIAGQGARNGIRVTPSYSLTRVQDVKHWDRNV